MSSPVTISIGPWIVGPNLPISEATDAEKAVIQVCWITDILGTEPHQLSWWAAGSLEDTQVTINAVSTQINFQDKSEVYLHKATIQFASSLTGINYRILADQLKSPTPYAVTFAKKSPTDADPVRLFVYGNCFDEARRGIIRDSFDSQFSPYNGSIILGNFTSEGKSTYSDYKSMINTDSVLEATVPSLFIRDDNETNNQDEFILSYLSNKEYFQATIGPMRVISISTVDRNRQRVLTKQREWFYNSAIQNPEWKNADFRMLVINDPPKTNYINQSGTFGENGIDSFINDTVMPMIRDSGADLVVFCNGRSYQRGVLKSNYLESNHNIHYIVTGAGSGGLFNKKAYSWYPPEEPSILIEKSCYHYLIFDFKSLGLNIRAVETTATAEGPYTVFDEFNLYRHKLP